MASREERISMRKDRIKFHLYKAVDEVGNAEDEAMCTDDDVLLGNIQTASSVLKDLLNKVRYGGEND